MKTKQDGRMAGKKTLGRSRRREVAEFDLTPSAADSLRRRLQLESGGLLSSDLLRKMDAYWRAANYLSVGQIYLYDNPLLKQPLKREHIKPRLLGHWGTTPGLNFIYVHLNRVIKEKDLNVIY